MEVDYMRLHLKHRNVWAKSEEIKKYPTLFKYVITGEESYLTESDNSRLNSSILRTELFDAIRAEWSYDTSKGENPKQFSQLNKQICDRCGKKTLIFVHYIVNTKNGNTMQVGEECIDEILIYHEKNKVRRIRDFRSDERRIALENVCPDILIHIRDLNKYICSFEVVIPQKLRQQYIGNSKELEKMYALYINVEKTTNKNVEHLKQTIINLYLENKKLRTGIEKYIVEARQTPLTAYTSYLQDLSNSAKLEIDKTGLVGKQAIYQLRSSLFNQKILPIISEIVRKYGIYIASSNIRGFVYSIQGRAESLVISLRSIVELVCEEIYGEVKKSDCTTENFLLCSNFYDSEDASIAINRLLHNTGYSFSVDDEYNELIIYRSNIFDRMEVGELSPKAKNAHLLKLTDFIIEFKENLLLNTKGSQEKLFKYINSCEVINMDAHDRERRNFNR